MALPHARSGEVVDLSPLGERLGEAKTTALVKTASFEAVRLIIHEGRTLPRHQVAGAITLHCLEGHVALVLDQSRAELREGQWLHLDPGAPHSVEALKTSSLLLTIVFAQPDAKVKISSTEPGQPR